MDTIRAMRYFVRAVELRSTTGLSLTEPGQRFYARALLVLEEFDQAVAVAQGATEQAAGLLRVNAPVAFGQLRLNALVQQFLARYPQVQVELILNDHFVDLVEEGVDVALRLGSTLPPMAVARTLGASARVLVASPAYLAQRGAPAQPDQLAERYRRIHAQQSRRLFGRSLRHRHGLVEFLQHEQGARIETLAGLGQRQAGRAAFEQAHAQRCFERSQNFADVRLLAARFARDRGQAAQFDGAHEIPHGPDGIHRVSIPEWHGG